jgi:hypothetical protein
MQCLFCEPVVIEAMACITQDPTDTSALQEPEGVKVKATK